MGSEAEHSKVVSSNKGYTWPLGFTSSGINLLEELDTILCFAHFPVLVAGVKRTHSPQVAKTSERANALEPERLLFQH